MEITYVFTDFTNAEVMHFICVVISKQVRLMVKWWLVQLLLLLPSVEWPQSSSWLLLSRMVRAGYVCVAIIHRTLTQTTGSLSYAQMLKHAIARGNVRTPKESLHWKMSLRRRSLAAPGNRTCVSGVTDRWSNQLSYIPALTDGAC